MQVPESDRSPASPDLNGSRGLPALVGVYICHCGLNIASKIDVSQVVAFAATLPGVSVAREYKFMCSDPGQELIQQDIRDGLVNRVVVASCSPLMHEATFRRATAAGGISPFLFQMANIREDVAWVTADGTAATEKAKGLVAAAVRRVSDHEPLGRRQVPVRPEVLVVGGGIAGIHAALTMAEAGKHVYLVEREATIGGHMAQFDKTFPTLDCAACILTPKMVQVDQHPNIELLTFSEVEEVAGYVGNFKVKVRKKARYIDEDLCTGCGLCVDNCTWRQVPSEFDYGLGTRPVVYTPFPQAVPRYPVIDRAGTSPCTGACPAGIKAHGYVSLIRSGKFEEAFQLVLEATPLVGTLGRACYAPCETACTRGELEGTVPVRRLKRFVADRHYREMDGPGVAMAEHNGKSVAVVGSGPAGLTAAWQLARAGYRVRIFEAASEPGGFLRQAIPLYRLPQEVVEQDIRNVTALGVEIVANTAVEDLEALKAEGYDAVLVATGTPEATSLAVPGEQLRGVTSGLDFLRGVRWGQAPDLTGKRVVVVGGGNEAMDAARTARRLGALEALVAYRRGRAEMPAHATEVEGAEREGVRFQFLVAPVEVVGDANGQVSGVRCTRMELGEPDSSGRRRPEPVAGSEFVIPCEVVISAVGLVPSTALFEAQVRVAANRGIQVDQKTLQTEVPYLFAAGDVVSGASDIARAVGQGRRAAHMIDRWLQGRELDGFEALDDRLAAVDKAQVLSREVAYSHCDPLEVSTAYSGAPGDFAELEPGMTEEEALYSAGRCLDCGPCSECGQCVSVCDADAIDLTMRDREVELEVGTIILSTGYQPFDARRIPEYGYGTYPNVYTSLEVERLLNASGPTQGKFVLRSGQRPRTVGIIHCVGSRDVRYNAYCSRVCCMYSLKIAHLIKERTGADVYNFYIDMRTSGKGYEEFYERVQKEGTHFVRGRVAEITEENGTLVVHAEDTLLGEVLQISVDMVVLAVGMEPQPDTEEVRRRFNISCGSERFFTERHPKLAPVSTFTDGVFLAGACQGPKDIPDTVAQAGAAAAEVLAMVDRGSVEVEPATAFVEAAACSGCRTCIGMCPFSAISFDAATNVATVNEVLCKGCGACVAACPSGAIQQHLFTDRQIFAELEGVLSAL